MKEWKSWQLMLAGLAAAGILVLLYLLHPATALVGSLAMIGLWVYRPPEGDNKGAGIREILEGGQEPFGDILSHLPVGLVAIDPQGMIRWHNLRFAQILDREGETLRGKIRSFLPELHFKKQSQFGELVTHRLALRDRLIRVSIWKENKDQERILYLEDFSELEQRVQSSLSGRPVLSLCQIDNYNEATQDMEEEDKSLLQAEVDRVLGEWALQIEGFLRKYADDRYFILMNQGALEECQSRQFDILDKVRAIQGGKGTPVTLSIGLGAGEETMVDLGRMARTGLELALGRGGDQVVVKTAEKVLFYGGNTEATEKRTRVKARVVANSLRKLIKEARQVMILGHESADLDSAGAALGMAKAVRDLGKPVWLILDNDGGQLDKLVEQVKRDPGYEGLFLNNEEARRMAHSQTLLIVVDTHKPSMLPDPTLLGYVGTIAVIDHHRRGEEFIDNHSLVYLESYASSTCELVAELIQYLGGEVELGRLEASALLAGITVDTKHFVFMTGARTFEAASFLRREGADPLLVQTLLRDSLETVTAKAEVVQNTQMAYPGIAVSITGEAFPHIQVVAAQAADSLLNVEDIKAAFVIYPWEGGAAISARSAGEVNVQILMERLGGGGHLTIAACQLKNQSVEQTREKLLEVLSESFKKEG